MIWLYLLDEKLSGRNFSSSSVRKPHHWWSARDAGVLGRAHLSGHAPETRTTFCPLKVCRRGPTSVGRSNWISLRSRLADQTKAPKVALESWPQAFQLLASLLPATGWTVLLLDKISWMAMGEPDFAVHLKVAWDNLFSRRARLVLVLDDKILAGEISFRYLRGWH